MISEYIKHLNMGIYSDGSNEPERMDTLFCSSLFFKKIFLKSREAGTVFVGVNVDRLKIR
jgi:hypothetical protein